VKDFDPYGYAEPEVQARGNKPSTGVPPTKHATTSGPNSTNSSLTAGPLVSHSSA